MVSEPELIEQVFDADPDVLLSGAAKKRVAGAMLGPRSLLLVDGEEQQALRKLMAPPFHRTAVEGHHAEIERICEEEIASWPLGEPIPMLQRMQDLTLRVIMSAIFGLAEAEARAQLQERVHDMHRYLESPWRAIRMLLANARDKEPPKSFLRLRGSFESLIFDIIERAREDPRLDEREDVLAMLIRSRYEDGREMTDQELRDQMITLLIQGHATTATALSWAIERLTRNPDMFEQLRAEAERGGDEYVSATAKETLRFVPPVPITTRLVKQPYQLGEYLIEPGNIISVNIWSLHRRPDLYPEPDRFRPERWLEEGEESYRWCPFGGGPRYCIGRTFATAEMKTVLQTLARRTRLAPSEEAGEKIALHGTRLSPTRGGLAILEERLPAGEAAKHT